MNEELMPVLAEPAEVTGTRYVADEEAVRALQERGGLLVPSRIFKDLETLDLYVHRIGVWKIQGGRSVVKQATADLIMKDIAHAIHETAEAKPKGWDKRVALLTNCYTQLFTADTRLQELIAQTERALVPKAERNAEPAPTVKSFGTGEIVRRDRNLTTDKTG